MGWLITLGILVLLGILPLGVSVIYDEDGALVRIIAGPLKIQVFPVSRKKKNTEKEKKPQKPKPYLLMTLSLKQTRSIKANIITQNK